MFRGGRGGACGVLVWNYWFKNGSCTVLAWRVKQDYAKVFLDSLKQDIRYSSIMLTCDIIGEGRGGLWIMS